MINHPQYKFAQELIKAIGEPELFSTNYEGNLIITYLGFSKAIEIELSDKEKKLIIITPEKNESFLFKSIREAHVPIYQELGKNRRNLKKISRYSTQESCLP